MQGTRYLLGAHCIGLISLFIAIGVGTHFYAGKLTTSSLKSAGGEITALGRLLHTPAFDEFAGEVATLAKYLTEEDDLYIFNQPGTELVEGYAVVCTGLKRNWPQDWISSNFTPGKYNSGLIEPSDEGLEMLSAEGPSLPEATFLVLNSPATTNYGRMCAVWSSGAAGESAKQRFVALLSHVKCLITPNFPLSYLSRNLLCSLVGNLVVVILAWSHSLTLPQPVSMVHAPRLIIYALLDAWRILILYAMKVAVESIPVVQRYLQSWEHYLHMSSDASKAASGAIMTGYSSRFGESLAGFWSMHILPRLNGYGGQAKFDASDHIVLYAMLTLIVITEMVCMVTYRRQEKKAIESPFTMRARGVFIMSLVNVGVLMLILYNAVLTSVYFHTPLEVWIGLSIAAFGIYLPFWLALCFLESLNFYF